MQYKSSVESAPTVHPLDTGRNALSKHFTLQTPTVTQLNWMRWDSNLWAGQFIGWVSPQCDVQRPILYFVYFLYFLYLWLPKCIYVFVYFLNLFLRCQNRYVIHCICVYLVFLSTLPHIPAASRPDRVEQLMSLFPSADQLHSPINPRDIILS